MIDVLIVEDNKELAGLLCDFLRGENYTVSVAENGEKALSLYEKYGARLIVLDIMLPDIDGFGVCKKNSGGKQCSHTYRKRENCQGGQALRS